MALSQGQSDMAGAGWVVVTGDGEGAAGAVWLNRSGRQADERTAERGDLWWVDRRGRSARYCADAYGTHDRVYLVMTEADLWNGQW